MKYIALHLRQFVRKDPVFFVLLLLCSISSAIVIHFSFGLYHHLNQKKLDEEYGTQILSVDFLDDTRSAVTKGAVVKMTLQMDSALLSNCDIYLEAKLPGEKIYEDPVMEYTISVVPTAYRIVNGKINVAQDKEDLIESGTLIDGRYFTAEEVESGEKVCLAPSEDVRWSEPEQAAYAKRYKRNAKGNFTIGGSEYKCIGHLSTLGAIPMIPVTAMDDACYVQSMVFDFDRVITRNEYEQIEEMLEYTFGDMAQLPPLDMPDADSTKFYNTLTMLCVIMIGISGMVFAMLYEYIFLQRRRQLAIYRSCGLSKKRARTIYFSECLLVSVMGYLAAVMIYKSALLPFLKKIFVYISDSCTMKTCGILGGLYVGITAVVLFGMIQIKTDRNVLQGLREE